jgi:hypothetical protein
LAARLSIPEISAIEFGVGYGSGLLAMERIAAEVSASTGVTISVFGFDSGKGLPEPVDYRDLPHLWAPSDYRMNEDELRKMLERATLVIGDVADTVPQFIALGHAPIGFAAFDLDFYSSTASALQVFDGPQKSRLPRTYCYFDDTIRPDIACYNDHTGELLAIREFNCTHDSKLCPIHELSDALGYRAAWHRESYVLHDFGHSLYCVNVGPESDRKSPARLARIAPGSRHPE